MNEKDQISPYIVKKMSSKTVTAVTFTEVVMLELHTNGLHPFLKDIARR